MRIVLSMTSYGERLQQLHNFLNWVPRVPYLFNLYIGKDEIIPKELEDFFANTQNAVLHRVEDLGPITKSYYSLQEFPNDVVFLIDDDVSYNSSWINFAVDSYVANHKDFSDCIIGLVCRKLIYNENNELEIMQCGKDQNDYQKSFNYITGHGLPHEKSFRHIVLSGAPGSFLNIHQVHKDFFNIELYKKVAFSHDEIWNWAQTARLGYKHVGLHSSLIAPPSLPNTQENSLYKKYNNMDHERKIIKDLLELYPEIKRNINLYG